MFVQLENCVNTVPPPVAPMRTPHTIPHSKVRFTHQISCPPTSVAQNFTDFIHMMGKKSFKDMTFLGYAILCENKI